MFYFIKRHWFIIFYFLITLVIFCWLVIQKEKNLLYDDLVYDILSNKLIENNFNLFTTKFNYSRTFFFPLYLAVIKSISHWFLPTFGLLYYYLINLLLFHGTNLLIYKALQKYSRRASIIFLIACSVNIITLSFSVLVLTETLAMFFTAIIFYLLLINKQTIYHVALLGIFASIYVFLRPSASILFACVFLYRMIILLKEKRYIYMSVFVVSAGAIFLISAANIYMTTGKINIFSNQTINIVSWHMQRGGSIIKYEGSIDPHRNEPNMYYVLPATRFLFDKSILNIRLPVVLLRFFTLFDRVYIDTYIRNVNNPDNIMRLGNYFVLSSVFFYFLFFHDKKFKLISRLVLFLTAATMIIYLPLIPESRYSVPVFPLLLAITSLYIAMLFQKKKWIVAMILGGQIILMTLLFALSNFTLSLLT